MPITLKERLVYQGIEVINACVEKLETWEDRSDAIAQLRAHLEARAEQVKPPCDPNDGKPCGNPSCELCAMSFPDNSDLL